MRNNEELRVYLGDLVSSENAENWWRPELFEKNTREKMPAELEIVSPPPAEKYNYNCFVHVLGFQNDKEFLGNENWEFTRNLGQLFEEMIKKNILKSTKNTVSGNLVVYRTDGGEISHVGLLESDAMVISKWSWGPLLRHKILDVPNHYGDIIEFYIISKDAKNFVINRKNITK